MAEIEKIRQAISILECMAIDLTGCIGGLSKKNPLEDVCRQRIEAINTAQSALREKLERSEGCKGCKGQTPLIFRYCPMCGRSLNGKGE